MKELIAIKNYVGENSELLLLYPNRRRECMECGVAYFISMKQAMSASKFCARKCANKFYLRKHGGTMKGKKHTEEAKKKIGLFSKGKVFSRETRQKISIAKVGDKNPNWKGEKVGYDALHIWIRRRLVKPEICSNCKEGKALDLANISQKYKRDLTDWEWLCRKCHMTKDGRIINLKNHAKSI